MRMFLKSWENSRVLAQGARTCICHTYGHRTLGDRGRLAPVRFWPLSACCLLSWSVAGGAGTKTLERRNTGCILAPVRLARSATTVSESTDLWAFGLRPPRPRFAVRPQPKSHRLAPHLRRLTDQPTGQNRSPRHPSRIQIPGHPVARRWQLRLAPRRRHPTWYERPGTPRLTT